MESSVAIAAIGLAATSVAGLIWVVKYFAKELSHDLREHTKAAQAQQAAAIRSTEASVALEKTVKDVGRKAELSAANSEEQLMFMKKLNGKLENAIVQKVTEQTVETQIVKETK